MQGFTKEESFNLKILALFIFGLAVIGFITGQWGMFVWTFLTIAGMITIREFLDAFPNTNRPSTKGR